MGRCLFLMALVFVMTAGGCIAAARKSIGTIVGPKGKMELIEYNGGIEPSEQVQSVFIVNKLGVQIEAKDISVLQSSIESQLAAAGLFGGGAADLTLSMELTRSIDRPARKVLELQGTLTRGDMTVGIAELTVNMNGFANNREVADRIGSATVEFLERLAEN
ncbi:MAG: hypothetical protein P8J86_01445 [Phycisphaerales bacterium]|nr:hypothetical protein [Phycisphaerales bacterium]